MPNDGVLQAESSLLFLNVLRLVNISDLIKSTFYCAGSCVTRTIIKVVCARERDH